jgi:hypothetical protein
MPGLVPGIHVLRPRELKDVDGRDKPGHDDYSALIPAALMIGHHFLISAACSAPSASGLC